MKATVKKAAGETSRTVPILAGVLLITIVLALLAFVHVSRQQNYQEQYVLRVAEQRVVAQELAKFALEAAQGGEIAFPRLRESRDRFAQLLGELINGAPESKLPPSPAGVATELQAVDDAWADLRTNADEILVNQDAILSIGEFVGVITEFIPQLAEASDQVVRLLVQKNAKPRQIYVASRQLMLAQRIENNVKRVLEGGAATAAAIDEFSQDAELFGRVLNGMLKGDERLNIERVQDPEGEKKLRQVAVLFKSINDHADEIIETTPAVLPALEAAAEVTTASDTVGEAAVTLLAAYGASPGLMRIGGARIDQRVVNILGGLALVFLVLLGLALLRDARRREQTTTEQYQRNQAAIRRLLDEMGDLADGDLTVEATVTEDITGTIADSINYAIEAMRGLVQTINETSVQVSSSAQESRATAMHLAEASEHQREQISVATGTIREMNVAIEKMAADAGLSAVVAEKSLDLAAKGGETVRRTISGMDNIREQIQETAKRIKRLGESSQEIGNIVELIEDIADQTNILALNAAMQAAMAGDAGRGFAVVADEVQRLAERATNATKQIEALVQTIQADTSEAVSSMESTTTEVVSGAKLAEDAGESLHEIEEVSRDIAGITKNIADSAGEQARQAANINDTMSVIQEITTQTTEGTNHTAESIGTLAELADDLRESVAGFRLPGA
jgi:twitching motility protein PilJ